jgi:hypothetical protein
MMPQAEIHAKFACTCLKTVEPGKALAEIDIHLWRGLERL